MALHMNKEFHLVLVKVLLPCNFSKNKKESVVYLVILSHNLGIKLTFLIV